MRRRLRLADGTPPARGRVTEGGDRLASTLDQLERAELYVVAALDLQTDDRDRRRLLEDLRAEIAAARRTLARPSIVG